MGSGGVSECLCGAQPRCELNHNSCLFVCLFLLRIYSRYNRCYLRDNFAFFEVFSFLLLDEIMNNANF